MVACRFHFSNPMMDEGSSEWLPSGLLHGDALRIRVLVGEARSMSAMEIFHQLGAISVTDQHTCWVGLPLCWISQSDNGETRLRPYIQFAGKWNSM
jgi:hypothetical protein